MVLPSEPNGRVVASRKYEFRSVEGRGRGLFLTEDVAAGEEIMLEEPAVIGPKQMSPLVGTHDARSQSQAIGVFPDVITIWWQWS